MLRINTSLVGMDSIVQQLDKCLDNPPHIFLVGFPGTGKSTIARDFIKAYFKKTGVSKKEESEYCVEISSHQDRGIHTFRQILNDHVRWIAPRKGVYRWIIIDDCDTLPAISQQALRRPMETFDHITRFLFISQNQESLITPLQSRCHIILIEPSTSSEVYTEILRREGFPIGTYTDEAYTELIMLSVCSIMKFQSLVKMLYSLKKIEGWTHLTLDYIKKSFDPHIWGSMKELLDDLMNSKWEEAQKQMYKIWELGYSFEDILFELEHNIIVMNVVDHRAWYNVQQFLIKSWIYHSQSRSSILDLMAACNEVKPWGLSLEQGLNSSKPIEQNE
jgi:DNA polymerase III delta prime subunit